MNNTKHSFAVWLSCKRVSVDHNNSSISQIPQCRCFISQNAPFCNRNVHMCAHFCYTMMHYGIYIWCIVGFVRWVYWWSHDTCTVPADTLRNNDVVVTSKRRRFDVITSKWRRFDVITALLFCHMFIGVDIYTRNGLPGSFLPEAGLRLSMYARNMNVHQCPHIHFLNGTLMYRKVSNIRRTPVGNKIVDHSDVVGASPVGAAPTTSSFST